MLRLGVLLCLSVSVYLCQASVSLDQCTINCGGARMNVQRGPIPKGPKGEMGRTGDPGLQGPKGEACYCEPPEEPFDEKMRTRLKRMEDRMMELDNHSINDCSELEVENAVTDQYLTVNIYPYGFGTTGVKARCFVPANESKKWTTIQYRGDEGVDFYRPWDDYVKGFGDPPYSHWLGLENIHELTKGGDMMLQVLLRDQDENEVYANYDTFMVGSADTNYRLNISMSVEGTVNDSIVLAQWDGILDL